MDINVKALTEDVFCLLKDEVKDLWKVEDTDFLKALAKDVAKQKILSITSKNPEVHKQNLLHLAATLESEVAIKALKLTKIGKKIFVRIIGIAIKAIALA